MRVTFANRRLRRCFEDSGIAQRQWSVAVARKYIQRVQWIIDAANFNALYNIRSLRLHPLSGQRADQFAISLNYRWRIVLAYDKAEETVLIVEVTNHYGD